MQFHNHLIDKLAVISGFVSGVALYPQIYEIIVNSVQNTLSSLTLSLIFLNNIVWLIYGIHRELFSLVIASFLTISAAGILLII